MIVRAIRVFVKSGFVDAFKQATTANHRESIREPGVLRFDVLQSNADPAEFLLYEVYNSLEATEAHKETPHYAAWKKTVEPMMAKPRESAAYTPVAPEDPQAW